MVFKIVFACLVLFQAMVFTEGQVILSDRCETGSQADDDLVIKMKNLHLEVQLLRNKLQTTEDRLVETETTVSELRTYLWINELNILIRCKKNFITLKGGGCLFKSPG